MNCGLRRWRICRKKGVGTIGKRIDWHQIHAEYVAGGISQHKLAVKYKIPWSTLQKKAAREKWASDRASAMAFVAQNAVQKTAEEAANNAVTAERIRTKLLERIEREIDALPDLIGSELRHDVIENEYDGSKSRRLKKITEDSKAYKLRDLTAAYKDLMADMPKDGGAEPVRIVIDV